MATKIDNRNVVECREVTNEPIYTPTKFYGVYIVYHGRGTNCEIWLESDNGWRECFGKHCPTVDQIAEFASRHRQ